MPVLHSQFAPRGYQQITSLTTAVGLSSIPDYASSVSVQAEQQDIRWRDDGTDPTASVGFVLKAGATLEYAGDLAAIKFIAVTTPAALNVGFYS